MPPNKRVKTRYPRHIDPNKLPTNVSFDPRGKGRWVHRDRKLKIETRLGDATLTVADLWRGIDILSEEKAVSFKTISMAFQKSPAWKKLAPSTKKDYENCHGAVCERLSGSGIKMGSYPLEAWDRTTVNQWMDNRGVESMSRMAHEFRYIKRVFRWAISRGYAKEDPTTGIRLETAEKGDTGRYVTDEELIQALILAPLKIALVAYLAYLTGRRKTDLIRMSRSQITPEGLAFSESKTGKRTIVVWSDDLEEVVEMLKNESDSSTMITDYLDSTFDTAWQRLRQKLRKAGAEPFKFQDLRAKHATDLDEAGGDATRNLVHSSPALTNKHYLRKARKVVSIR